MIISVIILLLFLSSVLVFIRESGGKRVMPSLLGWSIFLLTSILALISFFTSSGGLNERNFIAGTLFIGNLLGLVIIVVFLLMQKRKNFSVNMVDKISLVSSVVVAIFWCATSNSFAANLLLQTMMLLGYIVLINNITKNKRCVEPFLFWLISLTTGLLSFIPAAETGNFLAVVASTRSTVSVVTLLTVMTYYKLKYG